MKPKDKLAKAWLLVAILLCGSCYAQGLYHEKYRPQFHFSSDSGWMCDPCGFVHYQNAYHVFWWGKAKTTDLVHFTQQSRFAHVGGDGSYHWFTGSAVMDLNNTASFGKNKMIIVFTRADTATKNQAQALAYSRDTAFSSFQYYSQNPVLDISSTEFRDPTVFWYAPQSKWVMVVSSPIERKVKFYSSQDLKRWTWMSDFGPVGARQGIWECPDLIQLPVDGNSKNKKWVLIVSMGSDNHETSNTWSIEQRFKEQYFMGSFNGTSFTIDKPTSDFLSEGKGLDGTLFAGFDGNHYDNWTTTGNAFGKSPSTDREPVHIGRGCASSFGGNDSSTGTLISAPFTIAQKAINFLIGGGHHPTQTCINLIVDNAVVRTTTGNNSDYLKWQGWNVNELKGKKAQIQIVDDYKGNDWGHIAVDEIRFADVMHNENLEHALYVDYGSDFYASRTFKDYDNNLTFVTSIGWLGNWDYAERVPTSFGQGFWSVARNISLKTYPEGLRLVQTPVAALQNVRETKQVAFRNKSICGTTSIPGFAPLQNTYEMEATFTINKPDSFGFVLCIGEGRQLVVGYNSKTGNLFIDRTHCADTLIPNTNGSAPTFPRILTAPVVPERGKIRMRIFVDKASVEVFVNGGKTVLSTTTFPGENQTGVQLFSSRCKATQLDFSAWMLRSIWDDASAKETVTSSSQLDIHRKNSLP